MTSTLEKQARPTARSSPKPFKFGYLVHDVSRIRRTVMDQAMRPFGVTRSQWSVLSALTRGGEEGMSQVDLARLLDVGKVTVGGLIDRLENTGHVERRADANDRRSKRIFITEQGFEVIELMAVVSKKLNDRMLENVSIEHQLIAQEVLFKTKKNLKQILQESGPRGNQEEFGSQLDPRSRE